MIIPLHSYVKIDKGEERKGFLETLIFEDEGEWYVINIDKTSIPVLKEVYPDLKELKELQ